MLQKLSQEIIAAALAGFEAQKQQIDSKIAELRNMLDHRDGPAEAPKRKRTVSAASRRRMALAQKRRWAAIKGQSQAMSPAGSEPSKRRISEEGMKRIIAATKRRWALKRAEEAKGKRVAATRRRERKVTTLKAA
jgi:hypothetical protein